MPRSDSLPVYGPGSEYLYDAPLATIPRLLENGRVRPVGTRKRMRALIATRGIQELRDARPHAGVRFSDTSEASDNPRGVWRFNDRYRDIRSLRLL